MKLAFIALLLSIGLYGQRGQQQLLAVEPSPGSGSYRTRTLTIDHTKVPNTDQSSFPVLFRSGTGTVNVVAAAVTLATGDNFPSWLDSIDIAGTTYAFTRLSSTTGTIPISITVSGATYSSTPYFKTVANGGLIENTVAQTGGATITVPADFTITSDSGCATPLAFEWESWSATTGVAVVWFNEATLSHTADTVAYLCYSKSSVTTYQGSVNSTWNTGYKGVWHMQDLTTSTLADSTSNGNTLTKRAANNPAVTASGETGPAQAYVAANSDYARNSASSNTHFTSNQTIEGWFNATSASPGNDQDIIHKGDQSGGPFLEYGLGLLSASSKAQYSIGSSSSGCTTTSNVLAAATFSAATWYYVAGTWDGTTLRLYINGTQSNTTADSGTSCTTNAQFDTGLSHQFTTEKFGGNLDELRVSNVTRAADWLATQYSNQNAPLAFYSLGSQN